MARIPSWDRAVATFGGAGRGTWVARDSESQGDGVQ